MNKINVLIVEDQTDIAETHAEFFRYKQPFNPIGIASNIRDAKSMIKILKPDLIILDNHLPDDTGIELLRHLSEQDKKLTIDTIFVTASRDINVLKEAMYLGCFDYLIKPFTYDRLQESLNRYVKYCRALNAFDTVTQRQVDTLYDLHSRNQNSTSLPKGIESLTLDKILAIFNRNLGKRYSADDLSEDVGVSKTTSRRYLEYCANGGYLSSENSLGQIGRPVRLYYKEED